MWGNGEEAALLSPHHQSGSESAKGPLWHTWQWLGPACSPTGCHSCSILNINYFITNICNPPLPTHNNSGQQAVLKPLFIFLGRLLDFIFKMLLKESFCLAVLAELCLNGKIWKYATPFPLIWLPSSGAFLLKIFELAVQVFTVSSL